MGNSQSNNKHNTILTEKRHDVNEFEYQSKNLRRHNKKFEHFKPQNTEQNTNEIKQEKTIIIKCTKINFNKLLTVLDDSNKICEYYARLLIQDRLPVILDNYMNYSKSSEEYFNIKRKLKLEDLNMSYHDFYNELAFLNTTYEELDNNNIRRRNILLTVFDKSYKVQRHLIEDLRKYCSNGMIIK